jgi:hypothetical protein|tara:strand:- start:1836 stop:3095 length:1260 start_codon:yes stop_codon:yes gene_type:complete
MPALISQTREELAVSIGYNLHAVELHTVSGAGASAAEWVDAELRSSNDYINGYWWRGTSGDNDGAVRPVNDYVGSTTLGTVRGAALTAPAANDTYELWLQEYEPKTIYDFMNRAIRMVSKESAPWSENLAVHTYRDNKVYDAPSGVVGIEGIYYRASMDWKLIHNCNTVWDELVDANATASIDNELYAEGNGANKFVLDGALEAADIIASDDISSLDLSGYDMVEFWIYSTVALTAGQLHLRLSSSASAGTATEELAVPAAAARTWTHCRVALANPESDTAIISVGLIYTADIGAATVRIDSIRGVVDDSAQWLPIHRDTWWLGRDRRTIHFKNPQKHVLLKLDAYSQPTELTADTSVCDIEPEYIINKTTAIALRALVDRRATSREANTREADVFETLAQQALQQNQAPGGVRWMDAS